MSLKCLNGHDSTADDYCSECGDAMPNSNAASSAAATTSATSPGVATDCPVCHEKRDDAGQFCNACGYDFVNKVGGEVVPDPAPAVTSGNTGTSSATTSTPTQATPVTTGPRLDFEVVTSLPGNPPIRGKHSLFDEESLVGRASNSTAQTVQLPAADTGISRRQFMITRQPDNSFTVRDLDSSNGTKVNGTELKDGEERALSEGDVIEVGEYTKITVTAIRTS